MSDESVAAGATVLVAAAVIIEDGKLLITQRKQGAHLEGKWEFPGGKIEPGESPEEALVRELREEIGVETEVGAIVEATFWRYPKRNVLLLFYRTRVLSGEVRDLEVAAHRWVGLDALDEAIFPPADVPVLKRVRQLLTEAQIESGCA